MVRFTDETLMPFGKYKGQKLANIPASYLLFLLDQDWVNGSLKDYIKRNKDVLEVEVRRNNKMMNR